MRKSTMEGTITGRRPNYRDMGGNANAYYVLDHPEALATLPEEYCARLLEAIDDLAEALFLTNKKIEPTAELAGVKNSLIAYHDVEAIYQEIGQPPPKQIAEVKRKLEKRRNELQPGQPDLPDH